MTAPNEHGEEEDIAIILPGGLFGRETCIFLERSTFRNDDVCDRSMRLFTTYS